MAEPHTPHLLRTNARRLLRAAAWLVVIVCVVFFARSLHWSAVRASFAAANGRLALLALVVGIPCTALQALRWLALVRGVRRDVPLVTVMSAAYVGYAASAILPMRAGEAVRVELLARSTGMSRAVALGTLALDHTVNGCVMFLLAASLPFMLPVSGWFLLVSMGGIVIAGALVIVLLRFARPVSDNAGAGRLRKSLDRLRGGLVGLRKPSAVIPAAGAAVAAWGFEIAVTALVLAAFQLPHDVPHALGVLMGVNFALAIPSPPANLGNFELGAGMALVAFGGPTDKAAAFALAFHAVQLLPTLVGGLFCLPRFRARQLEDAVVLSREDERED